MALATLKYNENGIPKRAKYRIVVLGNLDPCVRSKSDCFAPVMTQLELQLFVFQLVDNKCILKNLDVKQAFCQSKLLHEGKYVMKPPPAGYLPHLSAPTNSTRPM
eukprot:10079595-Ditylum_brightwellii.AAC.1